MNILLVLEHYFPYLGGAEKLFKTLAESMVSKGFKVKVITTKHSDDLKNCEVIDGVEIIRVPCKNRFLFTVVSLSEIYKYRKWADLIHTTTYNAAIPSSIVGLLSRLPVSITVHEIWGDLWFKMPMLTWLERLLFSSFEYLVFKFPFSKFVAVSQNTYSALVKKVGTKKSLFILNGFHSKEPCSNERVNHEIPRLLFFGRLGASKGLDIILDTLSLFSTNSFRLNMTLVIPTYPKEMYQRVIKKIDSLRSLPSIEIELLHEVSEAQLSDLICNSEAVVLPSRSEGFGFAIAEACQMGALVITTKEGSISEVVSGKFVQIESATPADLEKGIVKALHGDFQETPTKHFSVEEMAENYYRMFIDLKKEGR